MNIANVVVGVRASHAITIMRSAITVLDETEYGVSLALTQQLMTPDRHKRITGLINQLREELADGAVDVVARQ